MKRAHTSAEKFLIDFHARHVGCTTRVFAAGSLEDGRSSYELLADSVKGDAPSSSPTILDLGCGDGHLLALLRQRLPRAHLVGVDLSSHELSAARKRVAPGSVLLLQGNARLLSLRAGSIDHCVSHLALMLFDELEAVFDRMAQWLRPGGRVAVIEPDDRMPEGLLADFARICAEVLARQDSGSAALGDSRAAGAGGLRALLDARDDFEEVEVCSTTLTRPVALDEAWEVLQLLYNAGPLDPEGRAEASELLAARLSSQNNSGAILPLTFGLRLITAKKRQD